MFAKLFETPEGQILVTRQENEDGKPEVRFRFEVDVATIEFALGFNGEELADKAFQEMTFEKAKESVGRLKENLQANLNIS